MTYFHLIQQENHSNYRLLVVWYSNSYKVRHLNGCQNMKSEMSSIQMAIWIAKSLVCYLDNHSNSGPFNYWTPFWHLNVGLVRYLDPHWIGESHPSLKWAEASILVNCNVLEADQEKFYNGNPNASLVPYSVWNLFLIAVSF